MPDFPDYVHAIYTSVKNTWQDAENLDDTHGYVSYVWIPEETFKVDVLKLHVWAEKFRAHSKAALAGGATVVTSGASSITTTVEGGSHRHIMFSYVDWTPGGYAQHLWWGRNVAGDALNIDLAASALTDIYTWETAPDHAHGMEHTHQVTLEDHTHDIDFGIYEEAITGRTLSAILYDPDGNLVKDFGVVCTGEDSVILDLSEYFETLQYGTWRLELSASGRLRARLLYYELAKMYAQY